MFNNIEQWFISERVVNLPRPFNEGTVEEGKFYDSVLFGPGDTLLISAGGCV